MSDGRRVGARLLCPVTVLPTERHVERSPGAAVSSQRRFLERLRGAVDPRPAAPAALLRLLAQRAAAEANGSSSRVGLAAAADATVAALRRAGTTASDLEAAGTARGKALSATLQAIDRRLSELDRADGRCPIRRADAAKLFDLALPKAVTLDGVVAVDGAQREAWLAVHAAIRARGGEGVTMRLPRLVGPAEPAMARAAEALEAELADEPDPFELEWVDAPPPARESVLSAHGDAAEARAVAAFVRAALDAGARPDRVLIVVPGRDEAFLAPLRASLREAAVPSSEAWGPPVDRSPEARSLLSILSMAGGRLDKDALIELLRTPGLHPGSLVGSRDEAEAVAKAERLAARLATLPILQDRTGALFVEVMRDALEQSPGGDAFWMLAALERLVASLAALRGAPTVDAFFSEVLQTVARLRLGDPSARELRHALGSSASTLRAIGEGAVAVRAAVDALEAMRDAHRTLGTHAEPPQRVELASDLRQTLGAARTAARGAASRAGAVRVGELREAPALDHDLIVVTRMTARGYAPDPAVTLLDEVTRRRLPAARRPRGARERAWAREAELAWALASARSVALSYSSTDDEGRDAGPPHKEVLAASLRGATVRREPSSRLSPSASFVSTRSWELARLAAGASPASDLSARVSIERERQAFFADPTARPSAFAGLVAAPHGPALVERLGGSAPETAVPVTFVERALKCPFRAFSDRVLGARRIDEGAELLDPRERGDLLHRALHAAYDANAALPPSATKDARLSAARAAVEKALGLGSYATPLRRVERERAANDALAVLSDELDAPAAVAYLEGELRFGPGEPEGRGPLALRAADGAAVYVKGRIDRVDASPDRRRLRVVDYKSGASAKSPGDYDLQLPIYAKASSRLLAHDGAPPELSAVYITVAPGGLATVTPKREAERALDVDALDRAERLAADTLVRLWRGLVPPRPAIATACTRCDARGLCRRPAVMADGDPAVDDAAGAVMDADRVIYGFSRNVVVAASAGTGKTHRLTCLYVMLTLGLTSMGRSSRSEACPPLAVDRIVATTFSRAAALEIRARIERSLSAIAEGSPSAPFQAEIAARLAELESPPSPAELAARAGRALASLHEARVETLHGLAADPLRRHAYGLGLSPSLQVLEESEAEALADGVIDEVLAGALDGEPSEREAAQALASACGGFFRARELIRPFFNRVDEEGLDVTSLRASDHLGAARDLYARLAAATERASASPRAQIAQAARALGAQLSAAPPDDPALGPEAETALETLFTQKKDNRNAAAVVAEGDLFELRDELSAQNSLGKARLLAATLREAKDLEAKERSVLALVAKIRARLSEEHAARGLASFGDLLRLARDGLRDHPEVAAAAKDEMDVLMVDEFQDTSLVQRDLVYLLRCRDGERAPGEDAEPEQLEGHGLFVVGDRKQSIYAFRGADVAVFNRVCGELCGEAARVGLDLPAERCSRPARADLVALSVSYRSGPAIVRFVNAFSALDFASAAGADPDVGVAYGPAEQLSSASDAEGDRVVLVRDDGAPIDEPLLAGDAPALREAFAAAALAHELTSAGGFELRDVAILARRRATIPLIEVALGRLGLPYVVAGRALFDTLEVRDLSALIRLVQDPHDRNALAHVLRGPMVALSEAALLALCTTRGLDTTVLSGEPAARPSARLDPESFPEESARLELFRARLLELRPALLRLPAADAMRTALSAFELDRVMAALPRASSRIGNLDRLLDLAGERGGSLLSFSRWLERQISSEADEPEAVVFSAEDDALRLLTIHGAKGLDFPATIVVDLASDGKVTPPPIDFLRVAGEPGARAVIDMRGDRHAKLANPTRTAARARGRVRAEAERARITYVAVTRARRVLGLIGSARTTQRKSMHKTLSDHADGALLGLFEVRASSELVGSALGAPTRSAAVEPPEAPLGGPRALAIASDVAIATTPLGVFRGCPRRFSLRFLLGLEEPVDTGQLGLFEIDAPSSAKKVEPFEAADEEPDPRDAGRAVHRVLETLPLARLGAPDLSDDEIASALARDGLGASLAAELARGVALFARGAYAGQLAGARRLEREAEVALTLGGLAGAPRLCLRGTVDAYAVFDDRIDLVDYKLARPSATLDPYAFQLRAYALALAREAPGSRVRAGILFVGADAEPRWLASADGGDTLGPHDHAAFGAELDALAGDLARARASDEWPGVPLPQCRKERCGFVTACHRPDDLARERAPRRGRR